jgi:hypothetical protein
MKQKAFISFTEKDRKKMELLKKLISESKSLIPIVIEDKREGALHLSDLVSKGINESNYFIPILTKNSITSQWVNQEIGFAKALNKNILPLLEKELITVLKGFIHIQIQLSYNYSVEKNENGNYKKSCISLIKDIDNEIIDIDSPENKEFINNQILSGELFIYENSLWLIFQNVRHLIMDSKTIERLKQIRTFSLPKPISIEELIKIKEGQSIKSKGPVYRIRPTIYPKTNNRL